MLQINSDRMRVIKNPKRRLDRGESIDLHGILNILGYTGL